ncbi:MAG: glycoside hydrolase family 26 protein [Melioribacter sp.]|nr:glycoside hydrolase family 26 protein [Melioribacter sp.]
MKIKFAFFVLVVIISSCIPEYNSLRFQKKLNVKLVDSFATKETVLLFYNLQKLSEHKIIFGHHDATAYGVGWYGKDSSDVKSVVNSYPGLYGWDFSHFTLNNNNPVKSYIKKLVKDAYERGGVNTFCWHYNNPVTDNLFYDTTIAVSKILPGGGFYLKYLRALDSIASFANNLKDSKGRLIPIIFRPFHEFDGSWFWWGKNFCTKEEFVQLWRTTVDYLRYKKGVKNFLYAYSPDRNFRTEEEYLERYPGDEYVDIFGIDNYYDFLPDGEGLEWIKKKLRIVTNVAKKKNKIAAFTETGLEGIVNYKWWTEKLLKVIDDDSVKIAYVMVWRNANENHHYAPYKGHPSSENFVEFVFSPKILLEKHLPNLYEGILDYKKINKVDFIKSLDIIKTIGLYPIKF